MKRQMEKGLALVLCTALLIWNEGTAAYAVASGRERIKEEAGNLLALEENKAGLTKDETVYVFAEADGSVKNIVVSDWIQNPAGEAAIYDTSELENIENVKGEEGWQTDGEHRLVWDAQGNDIYYQGNTDKELPISLLVSYQLDGKNVSAKELAGKSGRVCVRFEYKNNKQETVFIDGKQETIFVPFAVLTGMLLDNKIFTNVEVSNGRLFNDGSRTVVVGMAFSGLKDSLGLAEEKIALPDYVEITADTECFELGNTLTIATNEIFNHINTDKLDSFDGLMGSFDELADAVNQLTDGSAQLYDGLCALFEKSGELVSGIDALSVGGIKVMEGAEALTEGTSGLSDGVKELAAGLGQLTENSSALNDGAKQVFEALLQTAEVQLAAAGCSVPELTMENYAEVLEHVLASFTGESVLPPEAAQTDEAAHAAVQAAQNAAAGIQALKEQLDAYSVFYIGLSQYTAGVDSAKKGADVLSAGSTELQKGSAVLSVGIKELCNGIMVLKDGAPALTDGITKLRDGAQSLFDGLQEFEEQGIQKLLDTTDGTLGSLMERIKAVADVSKAYDSFSGLSDSMDGQVKFIYRTEAVKADR